MKIQQELFLKLNATSWFPQAIVATLSGFLSNIVWPKAWSKTILSGACSLEVFSSFLTELEEQALKTIHIAKIAIRKNLFS